MATEKIRTIRLYGQLGAKFGRVHELAVSSAAEAMRALSVLIPGFQQHLSESPLRYAVFIGRENIQKERLHDPAGRHDIRIAPMPAGAKRAGVFNLIVGLVLVVVGFYSGGSTWGQAAMMLGASMAVSGAMMMLSPQPPGAVDIDAPNNRPSYSFNGAVNTVAQGNNVPILYGHLIVGSAVISGGVYIEERT